MFAFKYILGQEEKAIEDAKKKKAKEAELAQEQQKQRKLGKQSDVEEHDTDEAKKQSQEAQLPLEVNGALTHSCVAIFEALETCDGDYLTNMNGSGFQVWYRNMLPVASSCHVELSKGPLAILHAEEVVGKDNEEILWQHPTWWDECSKNWSDHALPKFQKIYCPHRLWDPKSII